MRYAESICGNEITSYEVDIKNARLILHTQSPDGGQADIRFSEVLAHDFDNVRPERNVIRDVETLEFTRFMEMFKDKIPGWLAIGLPLAAAGGAKAEKSFRKPRLSIFMVNSSEGLSGVVFAKGIEIATATT